ncbi:MAG: tryptophan--tRNA ligase [bacterium JZ-2024 1]
MKKTPAQVRKLGAKKTRVRVVSGFRPTGRVHLGHYYGTLKNWLTLQEDPKYECYFFIADWHALTTDYERPQRLSEYTLELYSEWLAMGLDPNRSVIFLQSHVPQHAELALLLGMMIPLSWLERNPTYKEQLRELSTRDLTTYGFLGYPVLMAADVFLYDAERVPVGEDQLPHLELAREFARKFNNLYGQVLVEPEPLLTPSARVPGLDRRKMSKSYGNALYLSDEPDILQKAMMTAYTDPLKIRKSDPGHPDGCMVFAYHQLVQNRQGWQIVEKECKAGLRGCVACKKEASDRISETFALFRERKRELLKDRSAVTRLLLEGCDHARETAEKTMQRVRKAMGLLGS